MTALSARLTKLSQSTRRLELFISKPYASYALVVPSVVGKSDIKFRWRVIPGLSHESCSKKIYIHGGTRSLSSRGVSHRYCVRFHERGEARDALVGHRFEGRLSLLSVIRE